MIRKYCNRIKTRLSKCIFSLSLKKLLVMMLCVLLPVVAFAATTPSVTTPVSSFFNLTGDVSAGTLADLFGITFNFPPSNFFTGGGLLLDDVFNYFNLALLSFYGIIVAFIVIAGTLYTAQDGSFLGKKWSSAWIPMRAVAGSILIIPFKSGLCLAQYVVVLMIVVGIGCANFVWDGVVGNPNNSLSPAVSPPSITVAMHDQVKNALAENLFGNAVGQTLSLSIANPTASAATKLANKVPLNLSALVNSSTSSQNCQPATTNADGTTTQVCCSTKPSSTGSAVGSAVCTLTISPYMTQWSSTAGQSWMQNTTNQQILSTQLSNLCNDANPSEAIACGGAANLMNNNATPEIAGVFSNTAGSQPIASGPMGTNGAQNNSEIQPNAIYVYLKLLGISASSAVYTFDVPIVNIISSSTSTTPPSGGTPSGGTSPAGVVAQITQESTALYTNSQQNLPFLQPQKTPSNPFLDELSSNLVTYLTANPPASATPTPTPAPSSSSLPECKAGSLTTGGWWCAGSSYLSLDTHLAKSLSALQEAINDFTSSSQGGAASVSLDLINPALNVAYSTVPIQTSGTPLISGASTSYTAANPYLLQLPYDSYNATPLQNTAWTGSVNAAGQNDSIYTALTAFNPCPTNGTYAPGWSSSSCQAPAPSATGEPTTTLGMLRAMFPAPGETGYFNLQYLEGPYAAQIMLAAQLYKQSNTTANVGLTATQVATIYNTLVFLKNNGVAITTTSNPNDAPSVMGSPLYGVISGIFDNLLSPPSDTDITGSTNTDAGHNVDNLIGQIYNLGYNNLNSTNGPNSLVQEHFSIVQQTMAIGFYAISGTVDVMQQIYSYYLSELQQIKSRAQSDASSLSGWEVAAGFIPFLKGVADVQMANDQVSINVMLAGVATTLMWLPLAIFVLLSIFVAGISFAFLVPFIPFVLFWAGKIAWLLLIFEAMVAAPIMALGIAYPDGHDVWGYAEPGVKMSLNLMLMPMLIIIGLLVGMVLTYVVIHFTAISFHAVASQVLGMLPGSATGGSTAASMAQGIVALFMVLIYSSFMVMAFEKCFSPIYQIPEKVLQWIGVQSGVKFGEQEMGQVRQSTQQNAKEAGQAGGQGIERGLQAQQGAAKAQSEGDIQIAGSKSSIGQGVVQGGQMLGEGLGGGG